MNNEKTCVFCGGSTRFKNIEHVVMVGSVPVRNPAVMGHVCEKCGQDQFDLGQLIGLERRAVATALIDLPSIDGAAFRFARKSIGATQSEIAGFLGVASETVSRWETGALPISRAVQLGLLAAVQLVMGEVVAEGQKLEAATEPGPGGLTVPESERRCA